MNRKIKTAIKGLSTAAIIAFLTGLYWNTPDTANAAHLIGLFGYVGLGYISMGFFIKGQ